MTTTQARQATDLEKWKLAQTASQAVVSEAGTMPGSSERRLRKKEIQGFSVRHLHAGGLCGTHAARQFLALRRQLVLVMGGQDQPWIGF